MLVTWCSLISPSQPSSIHALPKLKCDIEDKSQIYCISEAKYHSGEEAGKQSHISVLCLPNTGVRVLVSEPFLLIPQLLQQHFNCGKDSFLVKMSIHGM